MGIMLLLGLLIVVALTGMIFFISKIITILIQEKKVKGKCHFGMLVGVIILCTVAVIIIITTSFIFLETIVFHIRNYLMR